MRLRHVLLLGSGVGAAGALLLAADIHRRVQEAQRELAVNATSSGSDSVIQFGDAHTLGLLALAFIFIAMFLMIVSEPLRAAAQVDAAKPAEAPAVQPVESGTSQAATIGSSTPSETESKGSAESPVVQPPPNPPIPLNPPQS